MKLDKIIKKLDKDTVAALDNYVPNELYLKIAAAEQIMLTAQEELDSNPKYEELRENLKALTSGKREINSRQRAIIGYCLHLLNR